MVYSKRVKKLRQSETFKKWYNRLKDSRAKGIIFTRLLRLEEGNRGDWKAAGGAVFELRVDWGPGYRMYCMEKGEEIVVLLCGGVKSTQQSDIAKAQKTAESYRSGKGE